MYALVNRQIPMAASIGVSEAQRCKCTPSNPGSLLKNVYNAAEKGSIDEIAKWLKTSSVDLNASSHLSRTVLHFACIEDKPNVIEIMMKEGACLNTKDSAGETPLMIASKEGHKECIKVLLKSQNSSGDNIGVGCKVDIGALTKYGEKTSLILAQEGLNNAEKNTTKVHDFQNIVEMLEKTKNALIHSSTQPRNNVQGESNLVEDERKKDSEIQSANNIHYISCEDGTQLAVIDAKSKETNRVTHIRDIIVQKVISVWKQIISYFTTHKTLLSDIYPWFILLFLASITLCLVTGYRSSVGILVKCDNNHLKAIIGSVAFPLKLNTVQYVANGCDHKNKIMKLEGDFSSDMYFLVTVASMTIAMIVSVIIFLFNRKCKISDIEDEIVVDDHEAFLYIYLPVLCFNSFLWFCASCSLATSTTGLKLALDVGQLCAANKHFHINDTCQASTIAKPNTAPLDFGAFFGFIIFFIQIVYILKLWMKYKND